MAPDPFDILWRVIKSNFNACSSISNNFWPRRQYCHEFYRKFVLFVCSIICKLRPDATCLGIKRVQRQYGGGRQKSWECQDSSDNALRTKFGPLSESRVRALPKTIDAYLRMRRHHSDSKSTRPCLLGIGIIVILRAREHPGRGNSSVVERSLYVNSIG